MKAKINEILEEFREFVTTHNYKNTPILTAYVNIDTTKPENQRERPAWLIDLKNESKRLEEQLAPEELKRYDNVKKWSRVEEMVIGHLRERPTGRSVVLFTDLEDLIAVDLPVSMPTRLYYGFPQIKHLLFALDQYKEYLVALFSGDEYRLVEVLLSLTTDELSVETDLEKMRRSRFPVTKRASDATRAAKDSGQDSRRREYERRFIKVAADEINHLFFENADLERLILGGNLKQAHGVNNSLHPSIRERVVAIEPIDFKLPPVEIARMTKKIADEYELTHDLNVVQELVELFNRNGTAVLEQQGVELALGQGRVKTLVIPYPIDKTDFDSLIADVVVSGAEVEFVYGAAADKLNQYGGIGARLYYSAQN